MGRAELVAERVMRLLIVDDTAVVRAALSRMAAERGWKVFAASCSAEARAVDLTRVAGAILDLEIGADSGVELATELRASRPDLPLVFLSAAADPQLLDRAREIAPVLDKIAGLAAVEAWAAGLARG